MLAFDEAKLIGCLAAGLFFALIYIVGQRSGEKSRVRHEDAGQRRTATAVRLAHTMTNDELRTVIMKEAENHDWTDGKDHPEPPGPGGAGRQGRPRNQWLVERAHRREALMIAAIDTLEQRVKKMPTDELVAEIDAREESDERRRRSGFRDEVRCVLWRERSRRFEEDRQREARGDA